MISPSVTGVLAAHIGKKRIKHIKRKYRKGDLKNAFLVIAATSDRQVNGEVSVDAGCLVNVVDAPGLSNFIVPSVMKRGPLAIAVSTSGASPGLAKSIGSELEQFYNKDFGRFAGFLKKHRDRLKKEIADGRKRQRLMRKISGPEMLAALREKGFGKTKKAAVEIIEAAKD